MQVNEKEIIIFILKKSMKYILINIFFICLNISFAQQQDSLFIKKLYQTSLTQGHSYENLRELCKNIGARLSGSSEAEMAILWSKLKMENYHFDTVYLQEIKVPHWERGTKETAWWQTDKQKNPQKLHILALGGSIASDGLLSGEIVVFNHLDELKKADQSKVKNKIVLLNQAMDPTFINTFSSYGACAGIRFSGAMEAAKLGAKGILIRSLGLPQDQHPHTGMMAYNDSIQKIPAAALSTEDCNRLATLASKEKVTVHFELDCKTLPDITSYNVIAEIRGKKAKEIITFGGHLDSWDAGEGAHDDGAGVIHCLEALRLLKSMNYQPQHTLRVVFFMNEENGNMGGKTYATWAKSRGEKHIAALESDRGGFAPRGFSCDGSASHIDWLKSIAPQFKAYELHDFEKGYGGVDINPLKKEFPEIALFGFVPDSQRYFDLHHTEMDVFETVNKRELELGCAAIASFVYLIDRNF